MPKTTTRAPKDDTSEAIRARHATEGAWTGVDEETQILTARGWLHGSEVCVGDHAFVLDPDTSTARFEPISSVTVAKAAPRLMRFTELGGYSSLVTHAHRIPTCGESRYGSKFIWRTTSGVPKHARLFRTADRASSSDPKIWKDEFVELVAWFWCEGWKNTPTGKPTSAIACLTQSTTKNPQHCAAIERALDATFPGQWRSRKRKEDNQRLFYLHVEPSRAIFRVTGKDKAPTSRFLSELTQAQASLLVERCLDGDGHVNVGNGGQRVWYQLSKFGMGQFQMACALAGFGSNAHPGEDYGNRFGAPPIVATVLKSRMAVPWMSLHVKSYGYKPGAPRTNAIDEWREYNGRVWNVETPSGTWLARRNWSVYFTGAGRASECEVVAVNGAA